MISQEYNRLSLVHQLGDEIVLGMDVFDANDIWEIIHNETREELETLAQSVREYIVKQYPPEAWSPEFLEKQLKYWVFQFTWRYHVGVDLGVGDDQTSVQTVKQYEGK